MAGVTNVSVLVPEPGIADGLKFAVALTGSPLADKEAEPPSPELDVTVIVAVPFAPPAITVTLPEFDKEKPDVTVRLTEIV